LETRSSSARARPIGKSKSRWLFCLEDGLAGDCWTLALVPTVGTREEKNAQGLVPTIGMGDKELTFVIRNC
jgi:hypothetical protein